MTLQNEYITRREAETATAQLVLAILHNVRRTSVELTTADWAAASRQELWRGEGVLNDRLTVRDR